MALGMRTARGVGIKVKTAILGVDWLKQALQEADKVVSKKAMRDGINEATKPVLKAEKDAVPVQTKTLKRALGRKVKAYGNSTKGYVVVGVVGARKDAAGKPAKFGRVVKVGGRDQYRNPVKYDHLVEGGTKPHSLSKGSRLAKRGKAATGQGTGKKHPGAKPKPFVSKARESTKYTVKSIIVGKLQNALRDLKKK
jgi:HK97 gp10 family phage protein